MLEKQQLAYTLSINLRCDFVFQPRPDSQFNSSLSIVYESQMLSQRIILYRSGSSRGRKFLPTRSFLEAPKQINFSKITLGIYAISGEPSFPPYDPVLGRQHSKYFKVIYGKNWESKSFKVSIRLHLRSANAADTCLHTPMVNSSGWIVLPPKVLVFLAYVSSTSEIGSP